MIVRDPVAFFAWLPGALSGPGMRCERAAFEADGRVLFRFAAGGGRMDVRWGPPRPGAFAIVGLPDAFVIRGARSREEAAALKDLLRARLGEVLARYRPAVLAYANRDIAEVVFERETAARIIENFIVPRETRCGDLLCEAIGFDGEAAVLAFGGRDGSIDYRLAPAVAAPIPGAGRLIAATGAFTLRRGRDDGGTAGPERRALERYLAYALHRCTHDGMTARVFQDSIPLGSTFLWGNDLRFQFFCEKEHDCPSIMNAMFAAEGRVGIVGNFERECLNQLALSPLPIKTFTVSRWYAAPREPLLAGLHLTDLNDQRSIMGGAEAIDRITSSAAAASFRDFGIVSHSCLPVLIGDSLQPGVIRPGDGVVPGRCAHILCRMDVGNLYRTLQAFWHSVFVRAKVDRDDRAAAAGTTLNLIGFGRRGDRDLEELVVEVGRIGVEVVARVVPSFVIGEVRRAFGAARTILLFDELAAQATLTARPLLDAPVHTLTGPFGVEGTRAWFLALAALCGKKAGAAAAWRDWHTRLAGEIDAVRARAACHRVAVVLGVEQIPRVLSPYYNYGVPLVPLFEELGFGLDIFVYDRVTGRAPPGAHGPGAELDGVVRCEVYPYLDPPLRADTGEIARVLREPGRHVVKTFDDFDGLMALLRGSSAGLLYSEIYRDRRAICAGKIPIDSTAFELGLAGMARTGRRLLALCETPFYREHAARLGDP